MDGGESKDTGSYGCIFLPALRCDNESRTSPRSYDNVGKVFYSKYNVIGKEKELADLVTKVDPTGRYHIPIIRQCKTSKNIDPLVDTTYNCDQSPDKKFDLQRQSYDQLIMPYGGVSLYNYRASNVEAANKLLKALTNIFDGLVSFKAQNFCHRDIKTENIVYNEKTGQARIIDFSLSMFATSNSDSLLMDRFSPPIKRVYHPYPLDLYLINYGTEGHHLTNLQKQLSVPIYASEIMKTYEVHNSTDRARNLFNTDMAALASHANDIDVKEMVLSIDTYSFGVVLYEVIKYNAYMIRSDLKSELMRLVEDMTRVYYKDRMSIEKARDEYVKIISKVIRGGKKKRRSRRKANRRASRRAD
jgi:hypothetical protein